MAGGHRAAGPAPWLVAIAAALFVLTVIHDLDHVRQGRALRPELYGVAGLALASTVSVFVLARRTHRLAGWAAVMVGVGTVVGVSGVHVAPHRSFLSDPYPAAHADVLSWAIILLMMATGLVMALVGVAALGQRVATSPR